MIVVSKVGCDTYREDVEKLPSPATAVEPLVKAAIVRLIPDNTLFVVIRDSNCFLIPVRPAPLPLGCCGLSLRPDEDNKHLAHHHFDCQVSCFTCHRIRSRLLAVVE